MEIRQAAGVVNIEVGENDVAHVGGVEPQLADLREGRLGEVELGSHGRGERASELPRIAHVVGPEAGIDEHESIRVLNQQDVTDNACVRQESTLAIDQALPPGTHRAAVQMMDHGHGQLKHPM